MKVLYLDCFSGISGDMTLGALVDCGVNTDYLKNELAKLGVPDYHLEIEKTKQRGITGTKVDVVIDKEQHHHRHYQDIIGIIQNSALSEKVKNLSLEIFGRIAKAEAKVHGTRPEEVHFHEVGAIDSIIDIVGAAICFEYLTVDVVYVSPINVGSGTVLCAHGELPVPAPATTEIIADSDLCVYARGIDGEAATPTGIAIAAELGTPLGGFPEMKFLAQGYGFGTKDFGSLNALRVILGDMAEPQGNSLWVLEANIDDMTGELAGHVLTGLFDKGVRDASYAPIYMKKNRPGIKLSVLVDHGKISEIENYLFAETTTIGIRKYPVERATMKREIKEIETAYGPVKYKVCLYGTITKSSPEYEDLKRLAAETGKPLRELMAELQL